MTAQVTEATPLSRGVGQSTLEGELQGPDYGRQQFQPPQLHQWGSKSIAYFVGTDGGGDGIAAL